MKTIFSYSTIALGLMMVFSQLSYADLPSRSRQAQQNRYGQYSPYMQNNGYNQYGNYPYGQGFGAGSSYYNGSFLQNNNSVNTNNTNRLSSAGDLLWIFTGSDSSVKDQVKSGFRSDSDTTFGGRLLSYFLGIVYRRIGAPIANRLGSLENNVVNRVSGNRSAYQNPYGQGNSAAQCYDCAQQNSTNPYQRNNQAINPAIFNGPTSASGTGAAGGTR